MISIYILLILLQSEFYDEKGSWKRDMESFRTPLKTIRSQFWTENNSYLSILFRENDTNI